MQADWYTIGLEDGARGGAGRNEGLKTFCTYERGYSEGRAGHAYAAASPSRAHAPARSSASSS